MTKDPHAPGYVDHFLQTDIISKLAMAKDPVRFSELKEDGIENSLFMYHANRLIARGLVQKSDAGFSLTLKGGRWANYAGVFHSFAVTTPRPLIQFVIEDSAGHVMLAVRKGQLQKQLNDYLLPGNIYRYGLSLEENKSLFMKELFGETSLPEPTLLTVADLIHEYDDDFVHHVIGHVFGLKIPGSQPPTLQHSLFNIEWVLRDSITYDNPAYAKSALLPLFFSKLASLKPHETFVIKSK